MSNAILLNQTRALNDVFSRSNNRNLQRLFRILSPQTRKEIEDSFLINECYLLPSESEINLYFRYTLNQFAYFEFNYQEGTINFQHRLNVDAKFNLSNSNINDNQYKRIKFYVTVTLTKSSHKIKIYKGSSIRTNQGRYDIEYYLPELTDVTNQGIIQKTYVKHFIDIKSFFNINKIRESCVEIDPTVTYIITLKYFDNVIRTLNNKFNLYLLDLYLIINGIILDIRIPDIIWDLYNNELYNTLYVNDDSLMNNLTYSPNSYQNYINNTEQDRYNLVNDIKNKIIDL